MADYLVQEDGSSKILLEDGSGILLETSGGGTYTKTGVGLTGLVGAGENAGLNVESGSGVAGLTGAGSLVDVTVKAGYGIAGIVGAGSSSHGTATPKVLQVDCSTGGGQIIKNLGANYGEVWLEVDVALDPVAFADLLTNPGSFTDFGFTQLASNAGSDWAGVEWYVDTGPTIKWAAYNTATDPASAPFTPVPAVTSMQFYRIKLHLTAGAPIAQEAFVGGTAIGAANVAGTSQADIRTLYLIQPGLTDAGFLYFDNIKVGTSNGASDIFADDFQGGDTSKWTSADAVFTVVDDPGIAPAGSISGSPASGRVLIAWDDGPLEPNPTWTAIDQGTNGFPQQFVAGFDTKNGRQTLLSQTDTGTATVYINDRSGLFDNRNPDSPYQGKLSGRQIMLQLYNPVDDTWEPQFRGLIDDWRYDIDGSAVDANGDPINASIQIECVDVFDYLNGYGLTPGLDGVTPQVVPAGGTRGGPVPAGFEDGVYYATTTGSAWDRVIEILADAGIDPDMYIVASGNTNINAVKYDPDESALTALRDAADAEFPFIANIYVNRHGQFVFRGRYSRFNPDEVAAEPSSLWDFTRWAVGDGKAIQADPTRAQLRALSYSRDRGDLINVAICYPQNLKASDMPDQVYANVASINAYGKHAAPPMSDLLTADYTGPGTITPDEGKTQCAMFAELLVKNKKDPRVNLTSLTVKAVRPDDHRADATWAYITRSDISHIVNVATGYPGGTGFQGDSPADDYYIEGRSLVVRPLNPSHDYVEYTVEVSPAVWSMDTYGVFPDFDQEPGSTLTADFGVLE